jgi:hypothetical protein
LLSGDNHGGAPGDNSDSLTTIYWGIPRQFPKTREKWDADGQCQRHGSNRGMTFR